MELNIRGLLRIQVSASSKKRRGLTFGLPQGLRVSPKPFGSEKIIIVVGPHEPYILGDIRHIVIIRVNQKNECCMGDLCTEQKCLEKYTINLKGEKQLILMEIYIFL